MNQQKINTTKPLFQEFIEKLNVQDVIVLFEIKSNPNDYGVSQPHPSAYCDIILNELKNYRFKSKIRIMSFDNQILEEIHKKELDAEHHDEYRAEKKDVARIQDLISRRAIDNDHLADKKDSKYGKEFKLRLYEFEDLPEFIKKNKERYKNYLDYDS